jgi:hypothetical protein
MTDKPGFLHIGALVKVQHWVGEIVLEKHLAGFFYAPQPASARLQGGSPCASRVLAGAL